MKWSMPNVSLLPEEGRYDFNTFSDAMLECRLAGGIASADDHAAGGADGHWRA